VTELAAQGLTNREIDARLFISPKTVEANLAKAYRKIGVRSKAELARHLARQAWGNPRFLGAGPPIGSASRRWASAGLGAEVALNGGFRLSAWLGRNRVRVLLAAGVVVVLVAALGVGVALAGDAGPASGGTLAGGGAAGGGGDGGSGGGGGGGGNSGTTTSASTTPETSTVVTISHPTTTVARLQISANVPEITASCKLSPAGYYNYSVHFVVKIFTEGSGILVFEWGRGPGDTLSPPIEREIPPERASASFAEGDSMTGRAPSAASVVVDRLHYVNPPGLSDLVMSHKICA
jgi:hypothetical protein